MGGKVIEFSADRILKQGIKQGMERGLRQGQLEAARGLFAEGVSYAIIRRCIDTVITDEELRALEQEATEALLQG